MKKAKANSLGFNTFFFSIFAPKLESASQKINQITVFYE